MKPINTMKLTIESRSINESFARTAVAVFAAQLDPTIDEISDIKTAVSEAVTNSIVHGYANTIGIIYIIAKIYPDNKISVTIKDNGCGIPDINQAIQPLYTTCKTGERAGLGFAVMESMMDKLHVRSKSAKGTTVTLEKKLCVKYTTNISSVN